MRASLPLEKARGAGLAAAGALWLAAWGCAAGAQQVPALAMAGPLGAQLFAQADATGMVLLVVRRDGEVFFRGYGETAPGSGAAPDSASELRLCSLTKTFTADLLARMAARGTVHLEDSLERWTPGWAQAELRTPALPTYAVPRRGGRAPAPGERTMLSGITLEQLATHTAGLPREIAPSPRNAPHFTFPDAAQRWSWLATAPMTGSPGERALYSNVGFDLLSDALAQAAGRPYPELLHAELLAPLGMWDTTLYPSPGQCARLMRGARDEGACTATDATAGSSGLYSTAHDVAKYLGYLLAEGEGGAQAPVLTPAQLGHAVGLDHAGQPTAMGLAWVQILPLRSPDHIVEKTGGGAGYSTYIAIDHARGTAVFVALTGGGERHAGREPLNPFEAANRLLLAVCGLPPLPAKDETPVLAPNGAVVGGRPRAHHRPERHTHAPHTRRAMVP